MLNRRFHLIILLTLAFACVGNLHAQISAKGVDFDVLATVTFQKGDSLWKFAEKYYNNPNLWTFIASMNNISDDKSIAYGTIVYIPVQGAKRKPKKGPEPIAEKDIYINEAMVDLKIKLDDALFKIDELETKIKLLEEQKTESSDSEKADQNMQEEINGLKDKNDLLNKELSDREKAIKDLESQLNDAKTEIDKLRKERDELLEEKNGKITELESEINSYKDEIQRLREAFSLSLRDRLIDNGFENVSVVSEDKRIIVTYENRIYRSEIVAMENIIDIISPGLSEYTKITLIPQNMGIPLSAITVTSNEEADNAELYNVKSDFDTSKIWKETDTTSKTNSSYFKFDIVIYPQLKARFSSKGDTLESQINLVPIATTTLWKGMSLSGQLIIPLQNDLDPDEDYWRPGILAANQTFRLPHTIFVSTTIGYFSEKRYGLDLEAREYFGNGKFFAGANIGYTGYASYLKGVWNYSNIGLLTWLFNAGFRLSRYDLSLVATYGKFLKGDKGIRLDISQQFDEVDIGFFAIGTNIGKDAGFNITMPIYPGKYLSTKRFRISPAKSFQLEHLYRGFPRKAVEYDTGYSIDRFIKRLNPDHVENQISQK